LVRRLKKLGFDGLFPGGKHGYMKRSGFRLIIPNPHGKQIDSVLVLEILKQPGISREKWLNA
jgi:predicted RNA binding protein YcfA (HicA-like mRNA interferase family)